MLNRVRQIVASLANNPALLRLLRDDPRSFSQHLGLSDPEMQALNGASDLVGKWGGGLLAQARDLITAQHRVSDAPEDTPVTSAAGSVDNRPGSGSGVPITSVVGIVGLIATVGTVGVVALTKADNEA